MEFGKAIRTETRADILKEAIDLNYVVTGLLLMLGITPSQIVAAENRICDNNMQKLEHGTIDDNNKLIKPKGHPKVDLTDLVA